ncbi:asparagine synthase (glutamine-hydrolyzing) [Candidatus Acetothermia bacterium]|nr:asparagine synthase (glutamine-hydrolyzing) [Candidatus Acetothermia bacterium]MBI3643979.1 asparagine synthase (glutamine-hydrolyzing) [Candidatus Acetothermia bacterium]
MCGICGMHLQRSALADRTLLQSMNDLLSHRGPDGEGFFCDKNVGLGNRRLSIIDLATGDQPIFNEDKNVLIVYNGELYNSPELREELIQRGHKFYTHSDTEVVVHLYEEYGKQMLPKLRGMFAFAIYDRRKDELLLARDALGIKPIFFTETPNGLYFASELRVLLSLNGFSRQIDPEAFSFYLTLNYIPAPWTIWKDARRLEPGHWLLVRSGKIVDRGRFFRLNEKPFEGSLEDAVDELEETLADSVEGHLLADVPVGAFLSGGLDSSLVVAMAQKRSSSPLRTFTVTFPDVPTYDESKYARIVADELKTSHQEIAVSSKEGWQAMVETLDHLDEPFADSSLIPVSIISKVTRQHVKVALSGDGGDELFAGYNKYQGLWLAERFGAVAPLLRLTARLPISESRGSLIGERWRQVRKLSRLMVSDPVERHLQATVSQETNFQEEIVKVSHNGYVQPLPTLMRQIWDEGKSAGYTGLNLSLYSDVNFVLPYDMLHKVDIASMQHSLEVRVPFVDPLVARLAFQLPGNWKLREGQRKWILRKVAERYLPQRILQRPKGGFGIPIGEWFRKDLFDSVQERLSPKALEESGIWNASAVGQLMKEHFSFKRDRFWELWNLFVFEWWRAQWEPHW